MSIALKVAHNSWTFFFFFTMYECVLHMPIPCSRGLNIGPPFVLNRIELKFKKLQTGCSTSGISVGSYASTPEPWRLSDSFSTILLKLVLEQFHHVKFCNFDARTFFGTISTPFQMFQGNEEYHVPFIISSIISQRHLACARAWDSMFVYDCFPETKLSFRFPLSLRAVIKASIQSAFQRKHWHISLKIFSTIAATCYYISNKC